MFFLRSFPVVISFLLVSFELSTTAFAAGPAIEWEIENRFRYFKRASDFREIARVYNQIKTAKTPKPTALDLEKALEKETLQGTFNKITGGDIRNGWAASIFLHTCGRRPDHRHASCKMDNGDDYLNPQRANLILRAKGISSGSCEWWIDNKIVDTKPCDKEAVAKDVSYNQQHLLKVQPSAGAAISANIILKDALILSLGDSFSAGEGNPEQPVTLVSSSYNNYQESSKLGGKVQYFPVREDMGGLQAGDKKFFGDLSASWTNTQCHRSLYSQHTKAALHYALEHPHVSVTFANYSCTGAEVYEGILNAWWARDDVSDASFDDAPQLVKVLRDLCKDYAPYNKTEWSNGNRDDDDFNSTSATIPKCQEMIDKKIDAVLLSIGGNDVGFARMISNSSVDVPDTFSDARPWVYGLWRKATGPQSFGTGLKLAGKLIPDRYQVLSENLKKRLSVRPYRVILSAYPDVSTDETGATCKRANMGMDVHSILGMHNPKASSDTANFVRRFHSIMLEESKKQGWRFADQHLVQETAKNSFKGHGLCAKGPAASPEGGMQFPRPEVPGAPPYKWHPFSPDTWKAYSERNRWLVTPNDAFLTTNYHDAHMNDVSDKIQPLYAATLSGSFHPNALGHSAIADSVLVKLRVVLGIYED